MRPFLVGLALMVTIACDGGGVILRAPMRPCGTIAHPMNGETNVTPLTQIVIENMFDQSCSNQLSFTRDDGTAVEFTSTIGSDPSRMTLVPHPALEAGRTFVVDFHSTSMSCAEGSSRATFVTAPAPRVVRVDASATTESRWHGNVSLIGHVSVLLSEDFTGDATSAVTLERADGRRVPAEAPNRRTLIFKFTDDLPVSSETLVVRVGDGVRFASDATYTGERTIEFTAAEGAWVPNDLATGTEEECAPAGGCASAAPGMLALVAILGSLRRTSARMRRF